jgi:hypothetical protein
LKKLKPIVELAATNDFCYLAATTVSNPKEFVLLAQKHIERYSENADLAKKEMKLLYSHLGKEWYQRARQAEGLRVFAEMRDKEVDEEVAVTAAIHWAETCFEEEE